MKFKSFIVTFATLVLTTGLLFLVGHTFTIPWLMFQHEYANNANGFFITTGSFVPLIIGLIVSFFAEKIYVYKYRQKLG
ncbi:hypothetical protein [Paenibacillus agricola]|jgi:ribose/xylose/arabinose/galactoside ABC-type transport system permease subunit|uniref:Uncharacterized protein n=1 Tax=Paenibacillus agricola TaxID=2716264 RepID=A0ABX0J8L6_9BACL|nr:hypothetical protein [Paenibacillus agricola]NHN31651.1 hypothetical protein [Paenibacillus agricola]